MCGNEEGRNMLLGGIFKLHQLRGLFLRCHPSRVARIQLSLVSDSPEHDTDENSLSVCQVVAIERKLIERDAFLGEIGSASYRLRTT